MSLNISPTINNNKTTVTYVVFSSIDYSYVKHICFSNNTDTSFIQSIKLHGIKIHKSFIEKISEIICDTYPVISDFIDSYWEKNFIVVIINNIVIYPCMNKDEFNLDTSAEIIDYTQSINKSYKDKFNSELVFPNQYYEKLWRKKIDILFGKNITNQLRNLITEFKNMYNKKINKYNVDKNKEFIEELTIYFNKNIIKISYEIRSFFQLKDHNKPEVIVFLEDFINFIKYIFICENRDIKKVNDSIELEQESNFICENNKNIIYQNNKLFFEKIMSIVVY